MRAEDNRVVASAQVDAVDSASGCIDPVVAAASIQGVVGTAQGDEVVAG